MQNKIGNAGRSENASASKRLVMQNIVRESIAVLTLFVASATSVRGADGQRSSTPKSESI